MSRVKTKAFWDRHVKTFLQSGMSQRAYCLAQGLKYRSLQYHLHKKRLTGPGNSKRIEKPSTWLPLTIVDEPVKICSRGIQLQISKITIEVDGEFDTECLGNILRTVGAAC